MKGSYINRKSVFPVMMGLERHFFIVITLENMWKVLLQNFSDNTSMGLSGVVQLKGEKENEE